MQLTKQTDFSLRVLMYLAQFKEPRLTQIQELCDYFDISNNHLSKVILKLGKLGFIETRRGKGGGILLAMPPADINIGEVIKAVEPNLEPVNCEQPYCRISPDCGLKGVLYRAVNAYMDVLNNYTLADLMISEDRFIELRTLEIK